MAIGEAEKIQAVADASFLRGKQYTQWLSIMKLQMLPLIATVCLLCGAALSEEISPSEVHQLVHDKGARGAIDVLFTTPRWETIRKGIASGKSEWLHVAEELWPGSDAGSASELQDVVAWALPHAAEDVLSLMQRAWLFENSCSGPPVDDPPEGYDKYFRDSISAVKKIKTPALQKAKAVCLKHLKSAAAR